MTFSVVFAQLIIRSGSMVGDGLCRFVGLDAVVLGEGMAEAAYLS